MPELPEVETIRRGLSPYVQNTTITNIIVRQSSLRWPVPKNLKSLLINHKITLIDRRAKYLLFSISSLENSKNSRDTRDNTKGFLAIHLGMSGKLLLVTPETPLQKHDHVDIILDNNKIIRFNDPRRFGSILWLNSNISEHERFKHLGPEPLTNDFNVKYIKQKIKAKQTPIKNFIMDNKIVVGVGNIYATEALFYSKISPIKPVSEINDDKWQILVKEIKRILKKAIKSGGTTLKDFAKTDGKPGYFKQELAVYGRSGEKCITCNSLLESIRQQGRTTVYCSTCQN